MKASPRLPLDALERYIGECEEAQQTRRWISVEMADGRIPPSVLAKRLGVSTNTIHRYNLYGIPYWQCDRIAIHLGAHPLEIWPNYYSLEEELCLT